MNSMTKLKKDNYYEIKLNISGRLLTYEGKITNLDKKEFSIKIEEESCPLQFKTKDITNIKQIKKSKKEEKTFKIRTKKKFTNLKKSIEPEF